MGKEEQEKISDIKTETSGANVGGSGHTACRLQQGGGGKGCHRLPYSWNRILLIAFSQPQKGRSMKSRYQLTPEPVSVVGRQFGAAAQMMRSGRILRANGVSGLSAGCETMRSQGDSFWGK